jgi:hypothetical protein
MTTRKEAHTTIDVHPSARATEPNHHLAVRQLYTECYSELLSTALDNPQITAIDANRFVSELTNHLDAYTGPTTGGEANAAFFDWASTEIIAARDFIPLYHDCEDLVYSAVWSILGSCSRLGCGQDTVNDVAAMVWLWAWQHRASLFAPNQKAKPSTRLYKRAQVLALGKRKHLLRYRERFTATMDEVSRTGTDQNGKTFVEPLCYSADTERAGQG